MRACEAIYAVEIFKFQQGEDAMLPYYIFFLPNLFIIHYSLFTNSVGRHVLQTKKREAHNRFGYAPHNAWQRATLPRATPAVPSPLGLFTSVFGMETGVTSSLWPPGKSVLFLKSLLALFLLKKHRAKSRKFTCFQIENMHGKPHGKLVRIC